MPRIQPAAPRFRVVEDTDRFVVAIPARQNWFFLPFQIAFLGIWAVAAVIVSTELFRIPDPRGQAFTAFWLFLWLTGGCWIALMVLWQAFGLEFLTFHAGDLSLRREVLGVGRTRTFDCAQVKALRIVPQPGPLWRHLMWMHSWGILNEGILAFDYGARTYQFGAGLDEAEAKLLVAEMINRYPQLAAA